MKGFTDYSLNIIEDVSKILDYFNKEKIVRIILMLFDVSIVCNLPVNVKFYYRASRVILIA
jgi:hypothetical protein